MKTYRGNGGITPRIMNPIMDRDKWSASRPSRFNPCEDSRYPLHRRLCGPHLDTVTNRKKPQPLPGIDPRSPRL